MSKTSKPFGVIAVRIVLRPTFGDESRPRLYRLTSSFGLRGVYRPIRGPIYTTQLNPHGWLIMSMEMLQDEGLLKSIVPILILCESGAIPLFLLIGLRPRFLDAGRPK